MARYSLAQPLAIALAATTLAIFLAQIANAQTNITLNDDSPSLSYYPSVSVDPSTYLTSWVIATPTGGSSIRDQVYGGARIPPLEYS